MRRKTAKYEEGKKEIWWFMYYVPPKPQEKTKQKSELANKTIPQGVLQ